MICRRESASNECVSAALVVLTQKRPLKSPHSASARLTQLFITFQLSLIHLNIVMLLVKTGIIDLYLLRR